MDLSKDGIVSRHFSKKVVGGLDEFEVRDFLHVLAEEMRHLTQLTKDQHQKLSDQESMLQEYKDREHILKQSISSAQEVSDRIRRDAESRSQLIIEKAQDKSDALIQEARHSLQSVYNDIADLKRLHLQFKTSLRASLQAQLELVEQGPLFASSLPHSPIPQESQLPSFEGSDEDSIKEDSVKEPVDETLNGDDDLQSLKDSLQSLDKDFS